MVLQERASTLIARQARRIPNPQLLPIQIVLDILLSDRELEPYFVYERTEKEFDIRASAISFEDLARATDSIYFHPRRRQQQPAELAPNNV